MPYATPTSPIPSPGKDTHSRKGWLSPPTHIEDMDAGPSKVTGPMPGIPRRSASSTPSSGHSTPRRHLSPAVSRQPSENGPITPYQAFPASRPMEGLPRRSSSHQGTPGGQAGAFGVSNLPSTTNGEGGLGLKLFPSPTKVPGLQRSIKDSISSTSTVESSLPSTPADETQDLPVTSGLVVNGAKSDAPETTSTVPFPSFEPPTMRSISPPQRIISQSPPQRPNISATRRNSALGHHRGNGPTGGSLQIPFPSSASASQLSADAANGTASPNGHLRPTSAMIRKKSGEVVKPSLKLRSMSTPDLSRKGDGTETDSPDIDRGRDFPDERSKSVRFAGGDDGDARALESVVLFLREQKPLAVGRAADPDHVGMVTDTETEADDTDASDFVQFRTRRNAAARAADEAGQIMLEGGSRVPRIRTDFSPDARGSLAGEYVVLERVELVNGPGPLCLRGTLIVRNVAFQKWVSVRFTLDHWQTRSEVSGTHVSHIPPSTTGDEGWDRFSFTIKLEDFKRKIEERQLILCLRYSIGDTEWWDSNQGLNYTFTFKKGVPRRPTRNSGPAAMGGGFLRLADTTSAPINLRQRGGSPTREISKAFGVSPSSARQSGPRNWIFPKLAAQHIADSAPARPESPQPRMPAVAYKVPSIPDVHTHLSLSKYCAPSPPQSPPEEQQFSLPGGQPLIPPGGLCPEPNKSEMNVTGGNYATLGPPLAAPEPERRSSWNGQSESWDSFAKAMEQVDDAAGTTKTDGDATPVAARAQSPAARTSGTSSDSSPERSRPLTFKRSTGDLRALLDGDDNSGLLTPPMSNLSSPPSPPKAPLPALGPMSPSSSITSTGESSPVETVSTTDSITDLANLDVNIGGEERGRSMKPDLKVLNQGSYQDFLDKFCFFTSPRMTPNDDPIYTRPTYIPLSGASSPNGFPFFGSNSSSSPRGTPTPTRQYDSSSDAFNFAGLVNALPQNSGGPATPRVSPPARSPAEPTVGSDRWAGPIIEPPASSTLAAQ